MKPKYGKEDILKSLTKIRSILDSSENPLTRKEIKTRYELRYGETDRAYDKAMVNFKNFKIYTLGDLLEEYPKVEKPYGVGSNTWLYYTKDEQIENWVKENSRFGLKSWELRP